MQGEKGGKFQFVVEIAHKAVLCFKVDSNIICVFHSKNYPKLPNLEINLVRQFFFWMAFAIKAHYGTTKTFKMQMLKSFTRNSNFVIISTGSDFTKTKQPWSLEFTVNWCMVYYKGKKAMANILNDSSLFYCTDCTLANMTR